MVENEMMLNGGGPNTSDAYTINGFPGPLYPCSTKGINSSFLIIFYNYFSVLNIQLILNYNWVYRINIFPYLSLFYITPIILFKEMHLCETIRWISSYETNLNSNVKVILFVILNNIFFLYSKWYIFV